jgi:hypothetical protein
MMVLARISGDGGDMMDSEYLRVHKTKGKKG